MNFYEELKKLQNITIKIEFQPAPAFVQTVQAAIPAWLNALFNDPCIDRAVQYAPPNLWPEYVCSWPDEHGVTPRDMSIGYVNIQRRGVHGRIHIHLYDWIIIKKDGSISVYTADGTEK